MRKAIWMQYIKPYWGRIVFTLLGIIVAILILKIGFWKTLLICFLAGIGYLLGLYKDKILHFSEWIRFWQDRW